MRYNFRVEDTRFIGVDLAWREDSADFVANETGLAIVGGTARFWTLAGHAASGWAIG